MVELVSLLLGVRQALVAGGGAIDGVALAEARPLQLNAVGTMSTMKKELALQSARDLTEPRSAAVLRQPTGRKNTHHTDDLLNSKPASIDAVISC
jgi:hypothetical protein